MEKLKLNDKVLYWDGSSLMDLSEVVSVDKNRSTARLANGVYLHREPGEDGVFHRSDYMEEMEEKERKKRKKHISLTPLSSAWKYGTGNTEQVWKAYCFKKKFETIAEQLKDKILFTQVKDIVNDSETLKFLENVERKISKLV